MSPDLFIKKFRSFVDDKQLFSTNDHVLVAVSGGLDSVVLCELMKCSGFHFSMAHMNFQLRDEDSDTDEEFVKNLAKKYEVEFHSKKVETTDYAKENAISIEMAARELRYNWFAELAEKYNLQYVATAHHLNDQTESVLLNLTRGTAFKGFQGIKPKTANLIRPLLFAQRKEIEAFANKSDLDYRFDKTNDDVYFQRNRIRKNVIPELELINPSLHETLARNASHYQDYSDFIDYQLDRVKQKICRKEEGKLYIDFVSIENDRFFHLYLYEILKNYGFNAKQVGDIAASGSKQSGKKFYSATHILIKDRNQFIISMLKLNTEQTIIVENTNDNLEFGDFEISLTVTDQSGISDLMNPFHAYLDFEKLQFPLNIRHRKSGDSFIPYGMKGFKKLSDFIIDQKINLIEKDNILVFISANDIVWVAPFRIDDRYKVTSKSNKILKVVLNRK